MTEKEQKASWKRRKQHSIHSLKNASEDEILVFIADKVSNLISIREDLIDGENLWDKFNASKTEIKWYYTSIKDAIGSKIKAIRIYKIFNELLNIFGDE